jgi:hypothetical protein
VYDKGGGGRGGAPASSILFNLGGEGLGGVFAFELFKIVGGSLRLLPFMEFLKILYTPPDEVRGELSSSWEDSVPGLDAPSESLSVKYPGDSGLGDLFKPLEAGGGDVLLLLLVTVRGGDD